MFVTHVIADEGARDAELHVGFEMWIALHIDLRDERLESLLEDQEMQMRRAVVVPALRADEVADGAVDRDRVAGGQDAAERKAAVSLGHELATQVHVRLLFVLLLVESFGR